MFFGPRVAKISSDELRQELKGGSVMLIDVREPSEFATGHVPGAINVPVGSLTQAAPRLDHDAEIIVICQSGHRSVRAAKWLLKAGFTNVRSVVGGTSAWREELER